MSNCVSCGKYAAEGSWICSNCHVKANKSYADLEQDLKAAHEKIGRLKAKLERAVELPCKVGDIVYRICPKCNDNHNNSCKNCAWASSITNCGCTTYGLWGDGQYPAEKCTVVPYKVEWRYVPNLLDNFGVKIFSTREQAEARLKELKGEK